MIKILFVCHGNICRSPMAEFIFRYLAAQNGCLDMFEISSAATSTEEIGNPVYPPVRRMLEEHGIPCPGKTARKMTAADYHTYDLLIGMDQANLRNMRCICGGDPEGKIRALLSWAGSTDDVEDPWYTRDFQAAWDDILEGCTALLQALTVDAGRKDTQSDKKHQILTKYRI